MNTINWLIENGNFKNSSICFFKGEITKEIKKEIKSKATHILNYKDETAYYCYGFNFCWGASFGKTKKDNMIITFVYNDYSVVIK